MDVRKRILSCEEIRKIDLVDYLSTLGYEPQKIRNADYWYISPLRQEKTPSFKINRKLNCWYDHGTGRGGNIIDFAIIYHNCTIGEFLKSCEGIFSFHKPQLFASSKEQEENSRIKIIGNKNINSLVLIRYLHQRNISIPLAEKFCSEITFQLYGKNYVAIGFKNNAGGYELRNEYFKGSSAPKDITTMNNGAEKIAVFEGFFDFLSMQVLYQANDPQKMNYCVLNSLSFFEKARPFMEQHDTIHLYLDNDKAGDNYSRYALGLHKKYRDESNLYLNYKDINEWLTMMGKLNRQ